ncbi:MAG TPA: aminotransferase class I/II-fold pyridoxal phosphate-dependent enzyme [Rhizomicrobium sp.]|jgi:8-amino-7-oxononanoate synthase|nr:aminotransferase class I/II-fold pyridoxal phosphate-dependent enzyme [Rhizomicrobium sp.]
MTTHSAAAGQKTIAAENEQPVRKSVVDDFAPYRALRRRIEDVQNSGQEVPFFQPRDGVSHSVIRRNGKSLVSFSGYNYLGLNGHPAVTAAAKNAIDKYGTSASASRIVAGQIELHGELERKIANFLGTEDALVFISGYLTNVTAISHLLARPDAAIYDSGAHNSIITGARLSGAKTYTYPNGDWDALDTLLGKERPGFRRGMIIAEGVYSMDGQILDLQRAVETKKRHNVMLMVDEAHSLGIVGKTGRGVCEAAGMPVDSIDVYMGTLSKTLASGGGYIAGDRGLIEYLRFLCPGLIFSVGLSPADTAAAIAALDILEREPHRPRRLRERARFFRQTARENGLSVGGDEESPVASLIVGDDKLAMLLSQNLLERGIEVQPIVRPAVSATTARLRFFLTANHTEEQILATVPVVAQELEKLRRGVE